jgi:AAA ATPase domain
MWPIDRPRRWVDRSPELATLRACVDALRHGGGAAVWVEGEPGIGKSSLVAEALSGADELGWDIGWGMGWAALTPTEVKVAAAPWHLPVDVV